jgi:hypothetical protein
VLDLDIDVVLIQEPYAYSAEIPVVANIPPGFSAFHHLSNDHAYGSVILIKDSFSTAGNLSVMHLSNFASWVELHTKSGPLRLASIYLRPSISDFPNTVQFIFDALSSPYSVFGLDSNAKTEFGTARLMTDGVKIWKLLFLALALTSLIGFAMSWILSLEAQRLLASP